MAKPRVVTLTLDYQNYIERPPIKPQQMYGAACSSDTITIDTWRKTWIDQTTANHQFFGNFKDHSLGQLYNINKNKPAVIVGSGPSLAYNGHLLKNREGILAISCLHNYHFFEDQEIPIDYYVSLDAGPVVLDEVSEGGKKTPDEYWESTQDKTLLAFIGSHPDLFKKWKGKVYLFSAPVPDQAFIDNLKSLEPFYANVSNGGNVLGACLYIAKGFFGSNPIAYVGADFCFSYPSPEKGHQFHGWESKYDKTIGNVMRGYDVFGQKTITWQSYFNFKNWFDFIALQVPGIYINCTEGGMLGAYPEGNLMAIKQMALEDFLGMYQLNSVLKDVCADPAHPENRLLF